MTDPLACPFRPAGTTGRPNEPDMREVFNAVPFMLGEGLRGKRRLRHADRGSDAGSGSCASPQAPSGHETKHAAKTKVSGGGGGIRTHGTLSRTPVFKTGAFDHSATPPTRTWYRAVRDSESPRRNFARNSGMPFSCRDAIAKHNGQCRQEPALEASGWMRRKNGDEIHDASASPFRFGRPGRDSPPKWNRVPPIPGDACGIERSRIASHALAMLH